MHAVRAPVAFDGSGFLDGGATVLIEGERIAGVEALGYGVPHDCPVAAFAGTLLPGLVDGHVHLVSDGSVGSLERAGAAADDELDASIEQSLREQVAAGVTTVRDLGDVRFRTLRLREQPGLPRVLGSGPPLTVPGGHCHFLGGAVDGPADITSAVAERAGRAVDVVKVMASGGMLTAGTDILGVQFSADDLALLVRAAHAAGLEVVAHAHSLAGIEHSLAAGVDGIEHFSGMTADGIVLSDELLDRVAALGIPVGMTGGNDYAVLAALPEPPEHVTAALRRLGLDLKSFGLARTVVLGRFREHGVRVVVGVDSGAAPLKRHGNAWRAVCELVAAGYPVDEALAAGTSVAADALGVGASTGRLRAGLSADLLVVAGDVGLDPAVLGTPLAVYVRGDLVG